MYLLEIMLAPVEHEHQVRKAEKAARFRGLRRQNRPSAIRESLSSLLSRFEAGGMFQTGKSETLWSDCEAPC